jgi:heme/copper-type cytochrome/quinol oxidase subunit 1
MGVVALVILGVLITITVKGWWPYLWREWLTSVDHKRIGVMYVILALVMLIRGYSDGIMMRSQQAIAVGGAQGYLPPELTFSPDVGVDYYLWLLQISGVGTLFAGINMVTTILKLRAPGMTYFRMPVFCWSALAASILIVVAFPVLTATFAMPFEALPHEGVPSSK